MLVAIYLFLRPVLAYTQGHLHRRTYRAVQITRNVGKKIFQLHQGPLQSVLKCRQTWQQSLPPLLVAVKTQETLPKATEHEIDAPATLRRRIRTEKHRKALQGRSMHDE